MVGAPENSKPQVAWLAAASRAREILATSLDLREAVTTGGAIAIVAQGLRTPDALRLALTHAPAAIVLISPPAVASLDADIAGRMGEIECPVLTLFGADDNVAPIGFGHAWRRALRKGFQSFVYGAGADMANQRPEAVAALIADFLARGEGFLVNSADARLYDRN